MSIFLDLEWNPNDGVIHEAYAERSCGESWYKIGPAGLHDLHRLAAFLSGGPVIGHQITSDIAALQRAANATGAICRFDLLPRHCTLALARARLSLRRYRLCDVARALGLEVNDERLHSAKYDAQLARDVYWRLIGVPRRIKNRGHAGRRRNPRNRRLASLGW